MEDTRHDTFPLTSTQDSHMVLVQGSKGKTGGPGNAGDSSAEKVSDGMQVQGGDPAVDWGQ